MDKKMSKAFEEWFQSEQGAPHDGMWSFAQAAWQAATAATQRDAMAVAEAVRDAAVIMMDEKADSCRNEGMDFDPFMCASAMLLAGIDLAAIVEAVRPVQQEAVNQQMLAALKELRDAYQEFMGLPACKANAAISAAEAAQPASTQQSERLAAEIALSQHLAARVDDLERQLSSAQQQGEPVTPDWKRKRADKIEFEVASGQMNAFQCFTQMRQLIDTTPPVPVCRVPDAMATPHVSSPDLHKFGYAAGWNACRAALLATHKDSNNA